MLDKYIVITFDTLRGRYEIPVLEKDWEGIKKEMHSSLMKIQRGSAGFFQLTSMDNHLFIFPADVIRKSAITTKMVDSVFAPHSSIPEIVK